MKSIDPWLKMLDVFTCICFRGNACMHSVVCDTMWITMNGTFQGEEDTLSFVLQLQSVEF